MRKNKVWLVAIIFGIMLVTTVCYITSVKNAKTSYANGRVVENTIDRTVYPDNDDAVKAYKQNTGASRCC